MDEAVLRITEAEWHIRAARYQDTEAEWHLRFAD